MRLGVPVAGNNETVSAKFITVEVGVHETGICWSWFPKFFFVGFMKVLFRFVLFFGSCWLLILYCVVVVVPVVQVYHNYFVLDNFSLIKY